MIEVKGSALLILNLFLMEILEKVRVGETAFAIGHPEWSCLDL